MDFKSKYGDVSTPRYFVEQILDLLPENIWYNMHLTWLDIGCGDGIFIECVYDRLMTTLSHVIENIENRKKHIINNMLFMIEINSYYIDTLKKKFTYESNIINDDFVTHHFENKFDIIIGNPPYNNNGLIKVPTKIDDKKKDGKAIWKSFIRKSFNILNKNGYIAMCIPALWMKPDKDEIYHLFFQYNILKIVTYDNSESNKIFSYNAQTPICCLCVQNMLHKDTHQNILIYDKLIKKSFVNYNLSFLSPIPLVYIHIFNVLQPFVKKYGSLSKLLIKTSMPSKKAILSNKKSEEMKFINIHSCLLKNKTEPELLIQYSNIPLQYVNVEKIVLAHKMYGFPFYDKEGTYGISNRDNYVIINKDVNKLLFDFLSTSFCRTLFRATRYRMKYLEKYIFELLPNITKIPNFPREINNHSLYNFFHFDFDIDLINDKYNRFDYEKN